MYDEHRAELLERVYGRGHELRLRRRRRIAFAAGMTLVVVAAAATTVAALSRDDRAAFVVGPPPTTATTTTTAAPACAASPPAVPADGVPADVAAWAAPGAPMVGEGALWTTRSALAVAPDHQPPVWRLKFPWFTRPWGLPSITGRRLDGPGTFHADANEAIDSRGKWVVSSMEFSGPGCWEVTARYRGSVIRFRLLVPAP